MNSATLAQLLEQMRAEYLLAVEGEGQATPYLTAERLCHQYLSINVDQLAAIVVEDPTLLAARAGGVIVDQQDADNPSAAAIISSNLFAAAMEGLLSMAVERQLLELDTSGAILVDEKELQRQGEYAIEVDYSQSQTAKDNLTRPGESAMGSVFNRAEQAFAQSLLTCSRNAYQSALQLSSEYAVFAPDELAPLIAENPLLLGLRADGMIDETLFEGDPPAGLIISGHLTKMLLQQLLDYAVAEGVMSVDAEGNVVLPDEDDTPVLH